MTLNEINVQMVCLIIPSSNKDGQMSMMADLTELTTRIGESAAPAGGAH